MKIYIKKNVINDCVFTLNVPTDVTFILRLYSNGDNFSKLLRLKNDHTLNNRRYNLFKIEETNSEDLENLKISLELGSYDYTVYKIDSNNPSLDLGNLKIDYIIETGKIMVYDDEIVDYDYDDNNGNDKEYTYRG